MKKLSLAIIGAAVMSAATMNTVKAAQTSGNTITFFSGPISEPTPSLNLGNVWYEFSFHDTNQPAQGCYPIDPTSSQYCTASSAGNSVFSSTPDWQFLAPESGAVLKVTDAFKSGDIFQIFDFGKSIGSTSLVSTTGNCGDNPEVCFQDPLMSHGIFDLAAGQHSISIVPETSPYGSGAGYFQITKADPVPESSSILGVLTFASFSAASVFRRQCGIKER